MNFHNKLHKELQDQNSRDPQSSDSALLFLNSDFESTTVGLNLNVDKHFVAPSEQDAINSILN